MLEIHNLSVKAGRRLILKGIDLKFNPGRIYAIMGPNGSGKSTLAKTIMGHPAYQVTGGSITFEGQDITDLEPHKRAKLGLFLGFQEPLALSGVNVIDLMRTALTGRKRLLEIRRQVGQLADKLGLDSKLIEHSLNLGASGGERKKLELLQAVVLEAKMAIFDEVDTGVDVDSLKQIATLLNQAFNQPGRSLILITHYNRILKYVRPDRVIVMLNGQVVKTGPADLADRIEAQGYQPFK